MQMTFTPEAASSGRAPRAEHGQTTVLMAALVVLLFALVAGLAAVGSAVVNRSRARTAADAVALAAAAGPDSGAAVAGWYLAQGVEIDVRGAQTWAGAGSSQAAAWSTSETEAPSTAPAVIAIVARAVQLLGRQLTTLDSEGVTVWFTLDDGARFAAVAADLGMCAGQATSTAVAYDLC